MATKNKTKMKKTKGGSPIIDVDVVANTTGGSYQVRKRSMAVVETKDGIKYLIPVDRYGRVPKDALYERFLDISSGSRDGRRRSVVADLNTTAMALHAPKDEKGWKPEELVKTGWWGAVNESDLVGVDDSTSSVFINREEVKPSMRGSFGKIALLLPPERQEYVSKTLQNNFTASELKRMTADYGLVIIEGNPGHNADGCYYSRQEGVDTPTIFIRPTSGEDTITHEVIHHARAADKERADISKTPFKYDSDGRCLPFSRTDFRNLEEAATVAESTARTREPTTFLGYYTFLKGNPKDFYNHDRQLLTNGKPLRGKRATDRVNSTFEDTEISKLKFTRGYSPHGAINEMRSRGQIKPRPKKKTTEQASTAKTASGTKTSTASKKAPAASKSASSRKSTVTAKSTATKRTTAKSTAAKKPANTKSTSKNKARPGGTKR